MSSSSSSASMNLSNFNRFTRKFSQQDIQREIARRSFLDYIQYVKPGYVPNWHHHVTARKLEQLREGEIKRLMILMPPRHGKSEQGSRMFPTWVMGLDPNEEVMLASYNASSATTFSLDVQRIMMSERYQELFPHIRLSKSKGFKQGVVDDASYQRANSFRIPGFKGKFLSGGINGGSFTGDGASLLIVDDPFKNHDEAYSQTYRDKTWNNFVAAAYTRGEGAFVRGGDVRMLIMVTPWHEDDVVGRIQKLMEEGGEHWDVVKFPAILDDEPHPEDQREPGQSLWKEKYDVPALERIRKAVGSAVWEGLYQCRPSPPDGSIYKRQWFQYYTKLPPARTMWSSWDMTFKETESGSYVVGQIWAMCGNDFYLVDQVRGRWGFTDTLKQFELLHKKWPRAIKKLVEDKANGSAIVDAVKKKMRGVMAEPARDSKPSRWRAVTPLWEAGNVYIPHPDAVPWVAEFESEILGLPKSRYNDQADAMAQALLDVQKSAIVALDQLSTL